MIYHATYSKFPHLKKGFDLRLGTVSYIVFLDNPKKSFALNKDAADILKMCDGVHTVQMIASKLAEVRSEKYEDVLESIFAFLNSVEYIIFSSEKIEIDKSKWGDHKYQRPSHMSIELTYNCNFCCKHCYNESGFEYEGKYIDAKVLINVLNEIHDLGVISIELTGGEPLLHPHFKLILKHCLKIFEMVAVLTNGYFITEYLLDYFTEYNDKISFQIALHGQREYMDWFCDKKGAFDQVINNIKLITKKDFMLRLLAIVTIFNYKKIEKTIKLAKSLDCYPSNSFKSKIYTIALSLFMPYGRGKRLFQDSLNHEQSIFAEIQNIEEDFVDVIDQSMKKFGDFIFQSQYIPDNCGAGFRSVTITPNGDIKICPMADESVLFGNIYKNNLKDIFSKNLANFFIDIKNPCPEQCNTCPHLHFCNNCIARGIIKYKELGEECIWGTKNEIINEII